MLVRTREAAAKNGGPVFGIGSRRLKRKLRQHGKPAMAMVLSTRRKVSGLYQTSDPFYQTPPTEATRALWTMTVSVQPRRRCPVRSKSRCVAVGGAAPTHGLVRSGAV